MEKLLQSLPSPWPHDLQATTRKRALASGRTIVVLDDDPTGTQTVHDVPVITAWTTDHIRRIFAARVPLVYILTNSRSLNAAAAKRLNEAVATALLEAHAATGRNFAVISRSDSTLRGHYPEETDALAAKLGLQECPVLLVPFFEEGGRLTIRDIHYVVEQGIGTPAAETPFARDPVFGFAHSNLRDWVEEKTEGRIQSEQVESISLESIRTGGPDRVSAQLCNLPPRAVCVINAVEMRDIEVVAAAIYDAWDRGHTFLIRSAASIVRALAGLEKKPLLQPAEIVLDTANGGLIAVGSHVPKSTRQLEVLLDSKECVPIELRVPDVLAGSLRAPALAERIDHALRDGRTVVLFTSREVELGVGDDENLRISRTVSAAMVETIAAVSATPRFLVAKGGITSSDIAAKALRVVQATVIGQLLPGVPVWRLGEETPFPGLGYVVFPGNVGDEDALLEASRRLSS